MRGCCLHPRLHGTRKRDVKHQLMSFFPASLSAAGSERIRKRQEELAVPDRPEGVQWPG